MLVAVVLVGTILPGSASGAVRNPRAAAPPAKRHTLAVPPRGSAIRLMHGVFPGGASGEEDDITPASLDSYVRTVGRTTDWVFFSNNWFSSRSFPATTAAWIRARGAMPFIRLMLRSDTRQDHAEPVFTLQRIVDGDFDDDLRGWARDAKDFGTPLRVEFGTEMNGQRFSWNGIWNGGSIATGFGDPLAPDGPERFVAAYRHVVGLMRAEGASNISWVFHADVHDLPQTDWNRFENYYPGDTYVDELAVSAYGTQGPEDTEADSLRAMLDSAYPRLVAMAPSKPIIVAELGTDVRNTHVDPARWAFEALRDLNGGRWPKVTGFSWWNEWWPNDADRTHDTTMRLQDSPRTARIFSQALAPRGRTRERRLPRSRLDTVRSWAFGIGRELDAETMRSLARYDLVVVDGEGVTAQQVASLHANGVVVLGYLSVGTIEPWRSWYGQVAAYELDLWGDWDEWYADVGAQGFRDVIDGQVAPAMLAKGLDGLFLDNTDMIDTHPTKAEGMRLLVGALSTRAHARGKWLFTQNGANCIGPMLTCYDGWNLEDATWSYDFDTESYFRQSSADIADHLLQLRRMRAAGLLTLATDYVDDGDTAAAAESARNARSVGALPFASDIELTRLP